MAAEGAVTAPHYERLMIHFRVPCASRADPKAPVEQFANMSTVASTTPDKTLREVLTVLDKMSGLPVVGADGKVVGVLSRKVRPARRGGRKRGLPSG